MPKPAQNLLFCFSLMVLTGACVNHDLPSGFTVECTPAHADIDYDTEIVPLILAKCAIPDCHGDNPDIPDWTQHDQLASHGSEIQRRITLPLSDPDKMPMEGSITQGERETLYCWIENGAPE